MPRQVINIGAAPNDGTGDPLRTAFSKANDNFLETYMPIGAIMPFAGSTAPTSWLFCSGQLVSRATYATLFGIISTTYGVGDGSTTFGIPDLRGRTPIGFDAAQASGRLTAAGCGINSGTLGAVGGNQFEQAHIHGVTDGAHAHNITFGATSALVGRSDGDIQAAVVNATVTANAFTGIAIQSTGSGSSQNVPPGIILNYIIFAAA
jgi:microcystin-dependent protein